MMGTSQFALPILQKLHSMHKNNQIDLITVYTISANKTKPSPVHKFADENDVSVRCTGSKLSEDDIAMLYDLQPDLIVVASYGVILRKNVLTCAQYGCINVHPSDLPRWRGAAPLQRSIMCGDVASAVCVMRMDEGVDTGDILLREDVDIGPDEIHSDLELRLAMIGGDLIARVIDDIENIVAVPQKSAGMTMAKKVDRSEERIDWNASALDIHNKIRALSRKPGAYCILHGRRIKILQSSVDADVRVKHDDRIESAGNNGNNMAVGTMIMENGAPPKVICGDGNKIELLTLQRDGKKMMSWQDFMRGERDMQDRAVFDDTV